MIPGERLLPMLALEAKVGLKRSKIHALVGDGDFPPGRLIFGKRLWRESEIDAWIERTWANADLCQDGNGRESTSDAHAKPEMLRPLCPRCQLQCIGHLPIYLSVMEFPAPLFIDGSILRGFLLQRCRVVMGHSHGGMLTMSWLGK